MNNILVTTDSFTPTNISLWEKYWDKLKENHNDLRVTVFTIPFFLGRKKDDICDNIPFEKWYDQRKEWVELGQHGYTHCKPPECKKFKNTQYSTIKRGMRKIGGYVGDSIYIFKAPYHQMNEFTISVLKSLGFTCCVYFNQLIILKKVNYLIPDFQVVETHTNFDSNNPDDIRFIFNKLDDYLFELENNNSKFLTIGGLIKPLLHREHLILKI